MSDRIPLLVLVRTYTDLLSYFDDWLDAVRKYPGFDVVVRDIGKQEQLPAIAREIEAASVTLLMHSTNGDGCAGVERLLPAFQARKGLLAVFASNEVNLPIAPMADKIRFLAAAQADLVITQLLEEAGRWLYSDVQSARVISLPHALNPDAFHPGRSLSERPIIFGARSFRYGPHLGDSGRLDIYHQFQRLCADKALTADIQIGGSRFTRAGWADFLASCRATISNEAGSFFLEKDDALMHAVQTELKRTSQARIVLNENSKSLGLARRILPKPIKSALSRLMQPYRIMAHDLDADRAPEELQAIQEKIFAPDRMAPYHTKCVSSRHFDAIGSRTVQVMLPGRYNDLLEAGEHYIPVRPDLSDIREALAAVQDLTYSQRLADTAREYAMENQTHAHRMLKLDREIRARPGRP